MQLSGCKPREFRSYPAFKTTVVDTTGAWRCVCGRFSAYRGDIVYRRYYDRIQSRSECEGNGRRRCAEIYMEDYAVQRNCGGKERVIYGRKDETAVMTGFRKIAPEERDIRSLGWMRCW